MQFHFHANQSHFHKNSFALRLTLKQRHKGTRKWPILLMFFAFPFSPFLFFLLQWLTFYWACLQLRNFYESVIETGNFYHGVATCSGRKFCSEFFTQLFEYFCTYLRLHLADHSDLGIWMERSLFFGQRWWRQKWKKGQGSSRPVVTAGKGVNG